MTADLQGLLDSRGEATAERAAQTRDLIRRMAEAARTASAADPLQGLVADLRTEVQALRQELAGAPRRPRADATGQVPRKVLSLREAARQLGIDRNKSLDILIRSGQVRTVPVNGGKKISLAEVERLARDGYTLTPTVKAARRAKRRQPPKDSTPGSIRAVKL